MAEIGIVANGQGHTVEVLPRFGGYLARYGLTRGEEAMRPMPSKRRQLPTWVCGCPDGNLVRASDIDAVCLDCGQLYRRVTAD